MHLIIMKNNLLQAVVIIFCLYIYSVFGQTDPVVQALTKPVNKFSLNFYNEVSKTLSNENLIMCPLSADIAFALLSLGARKKSQKELFNALYLKNETFIKSSFPATMESLNSLAGVNLKIANKVYVMKDYSLNPKFKKIVKDIFYAEIENMNFTKNVESAQKMNSWVEKKTENLIKDLINPNVLDKLTRLVLLNAIYFKADWLKPFDSRLTKPAEFKITEDDVVNVKMMKQSNRFPYFEDSELDAKFLELPYKNKSMSMVIILPNDVEGLEKIILTEEELSSKLKELKNNERQVIVNIPKFKSELKLDLIPLCKKLGINEIFTLKADLSGLLKNGKPDLYVSRAIQKAFIGVNEAGTEAAASTAIVVTLKTGAPLKLPSFIADHPFLYFIKTADGKIVFIGKYNGESEKSQPDNEEEDESEEESDSEEEE